MCRLNSITRWITLAAALATLSSSSPGRLECSRGMAHAGMSCPRCQAPPRAPNGQATLGEACCSFVPRDAATPLAVIALSASPTGGAPVFLDATAGDFEAPLLASRPGEARFTTARPGAGPPAGILTNILRF